MTQELQDYVWACLPKEFKEGVKKMYCTPGHRAEVYTLLQNLFGAGNLTSDAEGEELLTVSRKQVQELYSKFQHSFDNVVSDNLIGHYTAKMGVLKALFGSKCLPDNIDSSEPNVDSSHGSVESLEPKPAGPKYHPGQKVRYNGYVYEVEGLVGKNRYALKGLNFDLDEDMIEPYNEPEKESTKKKPIESKVSVYLATKKEDEEFRMLLHENGFTWNTSTPLINLTCWNSLFEGNKIHYVHPDKTVTYCGEKTSNTLTFSEFKKQYFEEETSPNVNNSDIDIAELVAKGYVVDPAKQFDAILKDGFSKERRLNIAAQMMQGLICAPLVPGIDPNPPAEQLAQTAFRLADALLAGARNKYNDICVK